MARIRGGVAEAARDEEGFTLVETAVATVLLLVALLPLAAAVVLATARPEARLQAAATALAQDELEATLAASPETWAPSEREDGLWRVRREVEAGGVGELRTVVVSVYRGSEPEALVRLESARLVLPPVERPSWAEDP